MKSVRRVFDAANVPSRIGCDVTGLNGPAEERRVPFFGYEWRRISSRPTGGPISPQENIFGGGSLESPFEPLPLRVETPSFSAI
jgi:hypothetical protein